MAVVLTLVQTKQIIYINETIQKHSKYKYTYYQNTHTSQNQHIHTPTLYKIHTYTHTHFTKSTHIHTPTH